MITDILCNKRIFNQYLDVESTLKIKKSLEGDRILSPGGSRHWAVKTFSDILANPKYMGDSFYRRTTGMEFPSTKRTITPSGEVLVPTTHHTPIISREEFNLVQKLRKERSSTEIGSDGKPVRKQTHYSSKKKNRKVLYLEYPAEKH